LHVSKWVRSAKIPFHRARTVAAFDSTDDETEQLFQDLFKDRRRPMGSGQQVRP